MDTTFITIHGKFPPNLSHDASIRYASDSIQVVLGYQPHEVLNRSCWDYFHPQELPFARSVHGRGVRLDKAAVLNYCSIRHKNGYWVGCECVFTVVYDVLIASTTVYGRGKGTQKRAVDAPIPLHEPRAALFVNRFTRTAAIMYATTGVEEILGLSPHQLVSKSFFYCIQEHCLRDAVLCLESAKANDSVAYLRFWFRNPLQDIDMPGNEGFASAGGRTDPSGNPLPSVELEAVASCTSDGLVVILRRARAPIPTAALPPQPVPVYSSGLFAAPWALEPVLSYGPTPYPRPPTTAHVVYLALAQAQFRAQHQVQESHRARVRALDQAPAPDLPRVSGSGDPQAHQLMDTIREMAVFAWGIVGINRSLEQYKCGTPSGDAQPEDQAM
ncbi:hypothetical protein N7532_000554 [Penicillium argentinense]|uniref:PAS domain-containing protein n=1 Tax=Penicillium argentinense TaxID=1131581 RepID=A0A9W9G5G2_9EURO|nr:uncharacterized protein N7532_000554 [Penicillium argentinense]KAJ5112509.1 hypothetical protein N7532_000554 [Penicillium argentinense]